MIRPGMTEDEAHVLYKSICSKYPIEKQWHPPKIRFGPNTICNFKDQSAPYTLQEEDIFFIDIGPVIDGHEADYGETFTVGEIYEEKNIAHTSKKVFEEGGRITFLGYISDRNMLASAYKACSLFCLPSTLETPGISAIEAAKIGSKLLLTSEGSCSEYFGNLALYVNPLCVDSISEGILKSVEFNNDLSFDKNKYSWGSVIKPLAEMYRDIIACQNS